MAANHLFRLLSSSLRPARPVALPAASRCLSTDAEQMYYKTFNVDREPAPTSEEPELPPLFTTNTRGQSDEGGFHLRLYMAGVSKDNVKVWVDRDELIAEGKREKDFEDDDNTNAVIRYRISRPPTEVFNLQGIKAEIKNGILKVFVPKID